MNPCAITCPHYRFRQGSHSWCAHPRAPHESIAISFRNQGAKRPDGPPPWCPLRTDLRCEQCGAEYLDAHPATAAAHHSTTCPGTLTTNP